MTIRRTASRLRRPRAAGLVLAAACAAFAALAGPAPAAAQSAAFPSRPLRLLVPLAAGSTADIASRAVAAELAKALGQPVVVENKAGAGGTIAMAELARAAPDGYTISFASQGTLVFNQSRSTQSPVTTPLEGLFAPIAFLGGVSNVMIVHAEATRRATPRRHGRGARRPTPGRTDLFFGRQRHQPSPVGCPVRTDHRHRNCCTCPTRVRRRASWR
jgi:hypothetical protein